MLQIVGAVGFQGKQLDRPQHESTFLVDLCMRCMSHKPHERPTFSVRHLCSHAHHHTVLIQGRADMRLDSSYYLRAGLASLRAPQLPQQSRQTCSTCTGRVSVLELLREVPCYPDSVARPCPSSAKLPSETTPTAAKHGQCTTPAQAVLEDRPPAASRLEPEHSSQLCPAWEPQPVSVCRMTCAALTRALRLQALSRSIEAGATPRAPEVAEHQTEQCCSSA